MKIQSNVGFKRPRTNRQRRYNYLRERGFLPEEAKVFSRLRRVRGSGAYAEVKVMLEARRGLYARFQHDNPNVSTGTGLFVKLWRQAVIGWYHKNNYTTLSYKLQRIPSPWGWFDAVSYALPEELRYSKDSRRLDKSNSVKRTKAESVRMRTFKQQAIEGLRHSLRDTSNPARQLQLRQQIRNLGGRA